jgi:hypothetical protein
MPGRPGGRLALKHPNHRDQLVAKFPTANWVAQNWAARRSAKPRRVAGCWATPGWAKPCSAPLHLARQRRAGVRRDRNTLRRTDPDTPAGENSGELVVAWVCRTRPCRHPIRSWMMSPKGSLIKSHRSPATKPPPLASSEVDRVCAANSRFGGMEPGIRGTNPIDKGVSSP